MHKLRRKPIYNISVLAILKNETMNLKVWLDHYIWQGVDHFYLIDNNSTDNPLSIINDYKSVVTYEKLDEPHSQLPYYKYMFKKYKINKNTKWLIVADLDEFWFSPFNNENLKTKLNKCHKYVIYSNWLMFGSNGYINHPPDIRTALIKREPDLHILTKWIIRAKKFKSHHLNIHSIKTSKIAKNKRIYDNVNFHLNHYPIQSKEFFNKVKKTRGDAVHKGTDNIRDDNYFYN